MNALHVLFKVADSEYVLPASDVLHMESFTGATRVPGTERHVAGLVHTRGRVVPVIDLRTRFGLPTIEPTLDSRVVVTQHGERTIGLIVDSAREVVDIAPTEFQPPPEVVTEHAEGFVKAVANPGKRLIMLIDLAKVVGEGKGHGE